MRISYKLTMLFTRDEGRMNRDAIISRESG